MDNLIWADEEMRGRFLLGLAGIGRMRSGEEVKKTRGIRPDNLCPG